jgi:AcrR family transcriptional regulator
MGRAGLTATSCDEPLSRAITYAAGIDATAAPRRPAHRPSRRSAVIDGAMGLFATFPVDEVTVLDIAGAVGMTPAAVYYHFASKEQILLEGLERFCADLLEEVRTHMPAKGDVDGLPALMSHVLAWTRRNRSYASVYFVNSIGINLLVEALRRATRIELIDLFQQAVRSVHGKVRAAEAAVTAVGLVSLLETSASSNLGQDTIYRGLGARRFGAEVDRLTRRIARLS